MFLVDALGLLKVILKEDDRLFRPATSNTEEQIVIAGRLIQYCTWKILSKFLGMLKQEHST